MSASTVTALSIVPHYFTRRRGMAVGVASSGYCAGFFGGPLLVQWLGRAFGYPGASLILGAIYSHTILAALFYRPLPQYELGTNKIISGKF